jgi:DNA-binding protein
MSNPERQLYKKNYVEIKREEIKVYVPRKVYDKLVQKCREVLEAKRRGEIPADKNPKVFGALIGKKFSDHIEVKDIKIFTQDLRQVEPHKRYMDEMLSKYAQPCPHCVTEDRGWVADPQEVLQAEIEASETGYEVLGYFHMHSCPIPGINMSQVHRLDVELSNPWYASVIIDMTSEPPKLRYFIIDENKQVHEYPIEFISEENENLQIPDQRII